jgi:ferrochelatase
LIAEKLGLSAEEYSVSFQSRFGPEEWLKPYTDETIKSLPEKGIKDLQVVCPGFSADCLETIEEIDGENREYFEHAGGEKFGYIPCLNDRDDHMTALMEVIKRHTQGWMETASDYDAMAHAKALEDSKARAKAMGCPV